MKNILKIIREVKTASYELAVLSSRIKDKALLKMADNLEAAAKKVIAANRKDLEANKGLSKALIDRLTLNEARIKAMAESLRQIASLKDPVGEVIKGWLRPNGLWIQKVRVPIGVVAVIYESRPNVTSDCLGLCLKSGNSCVLKGGSEAINTNRAIYDVLSSAINALGLPKGAMYFIDSAERKAVNQLLGLSQYIDLVIPRGGEGLIDFVRKHSKIPVIKHYKGVCHVYIDKYADLKMAQDISLNAKVQRPGVCNAMETLLVHKDIANKFLPEMMRVYKQHNVEIRACSNTREIVKGLLQATEKDWSYEYLDLILSVKVVESLEHAITHINHYGSHHSDCIVSENHKNAMKFLNKIDSACVYVNASTRFTDGYEFGMGAEIGISTDKLHARGPMALEELTAYKYIIFGKGQVRK